MSRWVRISDADLINHKCAPLVEALRSAALGPDQGDPVAGLVQAVVDRVRRKIASCASNRVDADGQLVPVGLRELVLDLVLFAMKNRLELELTDFEKDRMAQHERDLTAIARCLETVEQPDDAVIPAVETSGGACVVVNATRLQATRPQLAGL